MAGINDLEYNTFSKSNIRDFGTDILSRLALEVFKQKLEM